MLAFQRIVIADDAAGLRPVLVCSGDPVSEVTQRRECLLHVEDVAVYIHSLQERMVHELTQYLSAGATQSRSSGINEEHM